MNQLLTKLYILLFLVFVTSCSTYYQRQGEFHKQFVQGRLEEAEKINDKYKRVDKQKDRLLIYLQGAVVKQLLGKFEESNENLEKAYIFIDDHKKTTAAIVSSNLSSPSSLPYTGEDHEVVLIHYYKAINYLQMNRLDEALVECRRLDIKVNQLNDKYEKRKNRYKKDAFALNLMGMIYEADKDYNNAYIAYKNSYNTYKDVYSHFNVQVPLQLKKDLIRSAYQAGFLEDGASYEKEFGIKHQQTDQKELIVFWHNGLGPVKSEFSINFFIVKGQTGFVTFVNEELGISFPFPVPAATQNSGGFGDMKFVRAAFPKYLERKPYYRSAEVIKNGKNFSFELAEDINSIAFLTLEDRMLREFSNTLMRLALKQLAEYKVRQKNENLGALLSVLTSVIEKSDTRNWQTLPYSIYYCRIPITESDSTFMFKAYSPKGSRVFEKELQFSSSGKKLSFTFFHNLESIPLELDYY